MKPITGLLLFVALICYVFLPLFELNMVSKDMTGLSFTIDAISSGTHLKLALLPFVAGFLAIGFNCLKNRYWGILVVILIVAALYFYPAMVNYSQVPLDHAPEVIEDVNFNEGMKVAGVGSGFISSCAAMVLALLSAIISLMPLKINRFIEQSIDHGIEESKKHLTRHRAEAEAAQPAATPTTEHDAPAPPSTDHSAYLPKDAPASTLPAEPSATPAPEDHSRFMPH